MESRFDQQTIQGVDPSLQRYFYSDSSTDTGQAINLEPYQTDVQITLSDGTNTATAVVTLPSVAEAKGKRYSIRVLDFAGGVTIQDRNDSIEWSDLTVDADGEYALLESNGIQWFVLKTDIS